MKNNNEDRAETLCEFCLLPEGHTGNHVPQRPVSISAKHSLATTHK